MGLTNGGIIHASWDKDTTVQITLKDFKTASSEDYRVGVDVVLRDLVEAFCNDNRLPYNSVKVMFQGMYVPLSSTVKLLGVQDKEVVNVIRDPAPTPAKPPPPSQVYTIDD